MRKQHEGWHPADIMAAVRRKGSNLAQVALAAGLHETACRAAIRRKYAEGELAISRFLGVPPHDIWPDRWLPDGTRVDLRLQRKNSPVGEQSQRQKRRAA